MTDYYIDSFPEETEKEEFSPAEDNVFTDKEDEPVEVSNYVRVSKLFFKYPDETKNITTCKDGNIFINGRNIMPDIKDIHVVYKNDDPMGIVMKFTDGTREKAFLQKGDTFNLEEGVSICVTKKILSGLTDGTGSSSYNKIMKHAFRVMEEKEQKRKEILEERERKAQEERDRKKKEREKRKRKAKILAEEIASELAAMEEE